MITDAAEVVRRLEAGEKLRWTPFNGFRFSSRDLVSRKTLDRMLADKAIRVEGQTALLARDDQKEDWEVEQRRCENKRRRLAGWQERIDRGPVLEALEEIATEAMTLGSLEDEL